MLFYGLFYAHLSAQVPQSLSRLNAGFEEPLSSIAFFACLIPELPLINHVHKSVKSDHSAHKRRLFTALNQAGSPRMPRERVYARSFSIEYGSLARGGEERKLAAVPTP